jgi:hypothetical protein
MRSIVVRKRANEDWLAPKPIPNDLARVEAFALELLPDRLAPPGSTILQPDCNARRIIRRSPR